MKQVRVKFVARDQAAEVLEPADRSLHFPAPAEASQFPAILGGWLYAISAVAADQFDATALQAFPQRVTVGGFVVDQAAGLPREHAFFEQRLDQRHFVRTGTGRVGSQRQTFGIGEHHNFRALATLGLADLFTPFFAEQNVPSANDSSCFTRPCRSSRRISRAQAVCQMPASVQSLCRRQQVLDEGKRWGKSFQRAPLRSIHRMPSTQARAGAGGRPPWGRFGGSGNRSEMRCHCSSVSSNSGSIVDPAGDSTAPRDRFAMSDLLGDFTQYDKPTRMV